MPDAGPIAWSPSPVLPQKRMSFAEVGYDEMLQRARNLKPVLAERAEACERLRRLPDETERDLHDAGLFRVAQPRRVGGAELDVGIFVDVCAELARVCPSTAWNFGNLASHHWMLGYCDPRIQDEIWDVSPDTLIATSLAFPCGKGRKVDGGWEVTGRWPLVLRRRQLRLEHAGLHRARARRWAAGRSPLRALPSLAVRDHRHMACSRPRRHGLQGRCDHQAIRAGVPNHLRLGDERQTACGLRGESGPAVEVAPAGIGALRAVGRDAGLRAGRLRAGRRCGPQAQRHLDRHAGRHEPGDPDQGRRGERAHRYGRDADAQCLRARHGGRAQRPGGHSTRTSCAIGATPSSRCGSASRR